jgi:hypothetical protein
MHEAAGQTLPVSGVATQVSGTVVDACEASGVKRTGEPVVVLTTPAPYPCQVPPMALVMVAVTMAVALRQMTEEDGLMVQLGGTTFSRCVGNTNGLSH